MGDEGLDVDLDRLADHREGLVAGLPLADAAWQGWDGDAEAAVVLVHQHDLVLAWRGHVGKLTPQRQVGSVLEARNRDKRPQKAHATPA